MNNKKINMLLKVVILVLTFLIITALLQPQIQSQDFIKNGNLKIINILDAKHLDCNKKLIKDIYYSVKDKDNNWSEPINNHEYIRVEFESNLTNKNDITIYPKIISGNPRVEVYKVNDSFKLAEFSQIISNDYNKILLTNMVGDEDKFDLKVIGGSLSFDYIVDPQANLTSNTISRCGSIDSPGTYVFNMNINSSGTCLTINSSNVYINCNGYRILYGISGGALAVGINASQGTSSYSNLTIRNCNIAKNSSSGATGYGIQVLRFSDLIIYNNTILTNGTNDNYGIYINGSRNNITLNTIYSKGSSTNNFGVYLSIGSTNTTISGNIISTNGSGTDYGIYSVGNSVFSNQYNVFSYNLVNSSGLVGAGGANNFGIYIINSSRNNITGNNITTNGSTTNHGIYINGANILTPANNNTISNNIINANGNTSVSTNYGIYFQNSANQNNITNNNITARGTASNIGIYFSGTAAFSENSNLIRSNYVYSIGNGTNDYGIYLSINTSSNYIRNNTVQTNGSSGNLGIAVNGATATSSGNEISTNTIQTYGSTTGSHGIYLQTNASQANITGNDISVNGTTTVYGVYLAGVASGPVNNSVINNNLVRTYCSAPGSACEGIFLNNNVNLNNITGNDINVSGTANNYGIQLNGTVALSVNTNIVDSNTIQSFGTVGAGGANNYGIYITSNSSQNIVTWNNITTNGTTGNHGIYLNGAALASPVNNNKISNNIILANGNITSAAASYGIYFQNSANNNNITNNNITARGTASNIGIYLLGTVALSQNTNLIDSNYVYSIGNGTNNYGIFLSINASQNDIRNNTIQTNGTSGNWGIALNGTTVSNLNEISYNTIQTNGTGTSHGIYFDNSSNNNITYNNITTNDNANTSDALYIYRYSQNNIYSYNNILGSDGDGIELANTSGVNFPHNNTFIDNSFSNVYGFDLLSSEGVNDSYFQDQPINKYNFTKTGGKITFESSSYGKIKFLSNISGNGTNLSSDIIINDNFVYVNSSKKLNISANVTLYNIGNRGFAIPVILRDGVICNTTTSAKCYNFTSLTSNTVVFNVSGWSNYSIGEGDISNPNANLSTPGNNIYSNNFTQNMTVNISDNFALNNATLYIYNSTHDLINSTNRSISGTQATVGIVYMFLYNGVFNWFYKIFDLAGNLNSTGNFTITIDTINPDLNLTYYPLNMNYSVNVSNINYTYNDTNPGYCWYSNDSGAHNYSIQNAGVNFTNVISKEGWNNWTIYCNDSAGNQNSTNVTFLKDTIHPNLNLTYYPLNLSYGVNVSAINYTYNDTNPGYCWYSNDSGAHNYSIQTAGNNFTGVNTKEGGNFFIVYCNDSAGNQNSTNVTFFKDTLGPTVNMIYPTNFNYSINVSNINYSVTDSGSGISKCWYSNDTGVHNYSIQNAGTNWTAVSSKENWNNWTVYCNDTLGNIGFDNRSFLKDTINPNATLSTPINNTNSSNVAQNLTVNASDINGLSNVSLYIFNQTALINNTNISVSGTQISLGFIYTFLYNGIFNWFYKVSDSIGNTNSTGNFTITIDTIHPNLNLTYYPLNTSYNTNVSNINYTYNDTNPGYCWYSNDSGAHNYSVQNAGNNFTGVNTKEGSNFFIVYCNDSAGNQNSTNVTFFKDTTPPTVNMIYPTNFNYSINVSNINYSVTDAGSGISKCWYSNDSGAHNYSVQNAGTNWTDVISKEGWNNWTLYCNDTLGNQNSTNVTFFKDSVNPNATLSTPINNTNSSNLQQNFTVNASDINGLSNVSLYIFNQTALINNTNISVSGTQISLGFIYTFLYNGIFNWFYKVSDMIGNTNSTGNFTITIDTINPNLNLTYYPLNINYSVNVSSINYTYSDSNPGYCWYSNDSGAHNYSVQNAGVNFTNVISKEGWNNWTVYCNDSAGNINSSSAPFYKESIPPIVNLVSPETDIGIYGPSVLFKYNVSDIYSMMNCSLFLNDVIKDNNYTVVNGETQGFLVSDLDFGIYNWFIRCSDTNDKTNNSEIRTLNIINYSDFSGSTTDFSKVNLRDITNLVLERPSYGLINFIDSVDIHDNPFINQYIEIRDNFISVDTFHMPQLNKSAKLTFYNLNFSNPVILRDDEVCTDCNISNYSHGKLIFNVPHFTNYSVGENSKLRIYDNTDTNIIYGGVVNIYANYTNRTDNLPIIGANCNVSFNESSAWMIYNSTTGLYEYSKVFLGPGSYNYSINCSSLSFASIPLTDYVFITNYTGAPPTGVDLTEINSSAKYINPDSLSGYAGNISELLIGAIASSSSWQGYYGNFTGSIELKNPEGSVFYSWGNATPSGMVYASRSSNVNFMAIDCSDINQINSESMFIGTNSTDPDSVYNTFNKKDHPEFYVGGKKIDKDKCSSTNIYAPDGSQNTSFYEVLLSDAFSNIVYTSILENDFIGFDSRTHDFEMIVGENGHENDTSITPYYFYIELT